MEFKGKYLDGDRQAQLTVLKKKLYKKQGFGTDELLRIANDVDQTDLEARCLTIVRQTSCVI